MNKRNTHLSQRPRPRTVLVVGGDAEWRASACHTIGEEYPVLAASCDADAVRTARNVKPDLIVLETMESGGIDGSRILDTLENDPATRNMRVIVVGEISPAKGWGFGATIRGRRLWHSVHATLRATTSHECFMDAVHDAIGPSFSRRGGAERSATDERTRGTTIAFTGGRPAAEGLRQHHAGRHHLWGWPRGRMAQPA